MKTIRKTMVRVAGCGLRVSRELSAHDRSGFTLIEVVMIIVLVGIFMATIVVPFVEGIRETRLPAAGISIVTLRTDY